MCQHFCNGHSTQGMDITRRHPTSVSMEWTSKCNYDTGLYRPKEQYVINSWVVRWLDKCLPEFLYTQLRYPTRLHNSFCSYLEIIDKMRLNNMTVKSWQFHAQSIRNIYVYIYIYNVRSNKNLASVYKVNVSLGGRERANGHRNWRSSGLSKWSNPLRLS